ncbi:hypothetical protein ACFX2A_012660 [Malus domestica]
MAADSKKSKKNNNVWVTKSTRKGKKKSKGNNNNHNASGDDTVLITPVTRFLDKTDGSKVHKDLREKYGEEGYKEGDVIGLYINLLDGGLNAPKLPHLVWYKGQWYGCAPDMKKDPPKVVPGACMMYRKMWFVAW